jgi:hypothetical protein
LDNVEIRVEFGQYCRVSEIAKIPLEL